LVLFTDLSIGAPAGTNPPSGGRLLLAQRRFWPPTFSDQQVRSVAPSVGNENSLDWGATVLDTPK
ncbi:hypothetical protein A2U01_0105095, partial [Trifolium medium]|nr:hypothetical protein [Trifolium medium]